MDAALTADALHPQSIHVSWEATGREPQTISQLMHKLMNIQNSLLRIAVDEREADSHRHRVRGKKSDGVIKKTGKTKAAVIKMFCHLNGLN